MEAMEEAEDSHKRVEKTGHQSEICNICRNQSQRPVAQRQNQGHSNRNIKQLAYKNRFDLRERSVGENSLSGHGPIKFMNRRMRTRMSGGVGRRGESPLFARFCDHLKLSMSFRLTCR